MHHKPFGLEALPRYGGGTNREELEPDFDSKYWGIEATGYSRPNVVYDTYQ